MAIVRLIGANKDPIGSMDYEDVVAYKWEPFILGSNKGSYPLLDYLSIMGVQGTKKRNNV